MIGANPDRTNTAPFKSHDSKPRLKVQAEGERDFATAMPAVYFSASLARQSAHLP